MNIDKAYSFLNFVSNKTQSGNIKPSDFNRVAERAQLKIVERDYKEYEKTGLATDALSTFIVPSVQMVATSGQLSIPSNYLYTAGIRRYYPQLGVEVPVEEISVMEAGQMRLSQVAPATLKYPKYIHYDTYLQFYPKNVATVMFDYFRIPDVPNWAYTTVSNRPVYDAATSTDIELPESSFYDFTAIAASLFGINLREADLVQYAEQMKTE